MMRINRLRDMSGGSLTSIRVALALGFLVAMLSLPGCQRSSAIVVNFPDPGLEAAIRRALEKPTGDIHNADLIGLTSLEWTGCLPPIANLEGIQHCVNLTYLSLIANEIVDISPLSDLTKLEKLYLSINNIVDIQPLVDNTGLGPEDEVTLRYNNLYLTPVSLDMLNIEALERRGVRVYFESQKEGSG